jgi:HlyD family secretion protein
MALSRKKKIIIGVAAFVILGVIVVISIRAGRTDEPEVEVYKAEVRKQLRSTVTASGEVRPIQFVNQTSEVQGRIEEILVKEGDLVTKGQPLVRIDPTQLQSNQDAQFASVQAAISDVQNARNQITSAEQALAVQESSIQQARQQVIARQTDVDRAQVELDTANRELKRTTELLEAGVASRGEYDAAIDRKKQAEVSLKTAKANLDVQKETVNQQIAVLKQRQIAVKEARQSVWSSEMRARQQQAILRGQTLQRDKSIVLSQINGIVAEIPSKVGTFAVAGLSTTALMTIADMSVVNIEVKVDETEINKVSVGQKAKIKVDALGDRELDGEVTQTTPLAINKSATSGGLTQNINVQEAKELKVVIRLKDVSDDVRKGLRPGMSATATIETKVVKDVIAVPLQAIVEKQPEKKDASSPLPGSVPSTEKPKDIKGVYIIENNKVKFVEVTTGITGETDIEITSGVTAGMEIIKGPTKVLRTLKEDQKVKRMTTKPGDANANKS